MVYVLAKSENDIKICIDNIGKIIEFISDYNINNVDTMTKEFVNRLPLSQLEVTLKINLDFISKYRFTGDFSKNCVSIIYNICMRLNEYYNEVIMKKSIILGQIYLVMKERIDNYNFKYLFEKDDYTHLVEKRVEYMPVEILRKVLDELNKTNKLSEMQAGKYIHQIFVCKKLTEPLIGKKDSIIDIVKALLKLAS
jgi:hypothetical protein